jgi:hypothetical protein
MEQKYNVREAPAAKFDEFINLYVEVNEQNVDRKVWPIHHRWRAINAVLVAELLMLVEVDGGYSLQLPIEEETPKSEVPSQEEVIAH